MFRFICSLALGLAIAFQAHAAADHTRHALTVPMVEKFQAATAELQKLPGSKDDDKEDHQTVEEIVKVLDATPGAKPILSRYGFSTTQYALTVLAVFHAGFYLGMEPMMDKQKAAKLLASYPKETQANIELLRRNPKLLK